MKSGMKQVSVLGFDLILRQDVATVSGNPLECHLASKTAKLISKNEKRCFWALGPWAPLALRYGV